jgi:hypothetical protein
MQRTLLLNERAAGLTASFSVLRQGVSLPKGSCSNDISTNGDDSANFARDYYHY